MTPPEFTVKEERRKDAPSKRAWDKAYGRKCKMVVVCEFKNGHTFTKRFGFLIEDEHPVMQAYLRKYCYKAAIEEYQILYGDPDAPPPQGFMNSNALQEDE